MLVNQFKKFHGTPKISAHEQIKDSDWSISIYGSHNAAVTIARGKTILEVIELERFLNLKNIGLTVHLTPAKNLIPVYAALLRDYIDKKYGVKQFDHGFYQYPSINLGDEKNPVIWSVYDVFPAKYYKNCSHHYSHASGVFYQSPFKEAIVFTCDGGGNDGFFHVYHMTRGQDPKFLHQYYPLDLGLSYMTFGEILGDIKKERNIKIGNLVYPGKIMGLVSYGNPNLDWVNAFKEYYFTRTNAWNFHEHLQILGKRINVDLTKERLTGQIAYDIAATSQYAFENILFEIMDPLAEQYDLPFCFAGGCALNILANTKITQRYNREVFVGPNPSDCGLSLGMMLDFIRPETAYNATYAGLPLLDLELLPHYLSENNFRATQLDIENLAKIIVDGKIIGVARGRSEHGPRSLGNRSILCNPMIREMKNILNSKVKNREWYRPFAPVVRLEDVSEYFEWTKESPWMSFAPLVKEQYRDVLPSITHYDNTARVQTVTREQNTFLYDLITEVKKLTGIGVLLNTSFNVDGKPILTTVKDIFQILKSTQLDGAVIEDTIVLK